MSKILNFKPGYLKLKTDKSFRPLLKSCSLLRQQVLCGAEVNKMSVVDDYVNQFKILCVKP